jgi:hypothetical protein
MALKTDSPLIYHIMIGDCKDSLSKKQQVTGDEEQIIDMVG